MAENKEKEARGTLKIGEPHPMAYTVRDYIWKWTNSELVIAREAMASCAIEGNRAAEVCGETLDRLRQGLPHCRLTEEQTEACKVDQPKDDLVLGRTRQEIQKLQQRKI